MDVLINLKFLIRESYITGVTGRKKAISLSQMELANEKTLTLMIL